MNEVEKFNQWYEKEKSKGLLDIKFDLVNIKQATLEQIFAEINRAIEAPNVKDNDFF